MSKIALIYAYWQNQPFGVTWCDLPWAMREGGLSKRLDDDGHDVVESIVMYEGEHPDELLAGFQVARDVAAEVTKARSEGELPVILCGSCAVAAIGAIGGLHADEQTDPSLTGVAWLDAHPDLNTPETTSSGLFEGMALSAIHGNAYRQLADEHVSLKPIVPGQTIMIGVRDIEAAEHAALDRLSIRHAADEDAVASALGGVARTYLHLDMDVHDAVQVRTNTYPVPGGLSAAATRNFVSCIPNVGALAVTGLDPAAADKDLAVDIAIGHVVAAASAWEDTPA
ncbi:MAG: arginase family protein [Pseudomonadota bacterium]